VAIWGLGALCAVAPDLDAVVSFLFGIPYSHVLGHRGLSHSLLVAAVLATLVTAVARRNLAESPGTAKLWLFFFLATASHGLLDAMTNGGLGVAFFAPFSGYFAKTSFRSEVTRAAGSVRILRSSSPTTWKRPSSALPTT
jgi:membrane-bound metal-dependent hydrolase YbcI (DUF457 family)